MGTFGGGIQMSKKKLPYLVRCMKCNCIWELVQTPPGPREGGCGKMSYKLFDAKQKPQRCCDNDPRAAFVCTPILDKEEVKKLVESKAK